MYYSPLPDALLHVSEMTTAQIVHVVTRWMKEMQKPFIKVWPNGVASQHRYCTHLSNTLKVIISKKNMYF